ncbi:MAG: hypothetical protein ACREOI_08910 [bacterium]
MNQQEVDAKTMIEYLLGDLSEDERIQLQERFLTDNECFEQLQAVEEDLIDDYVHHKLSKADRRRFERYYLVTPARQEKVDFAVDLKKTLTVPWWQAWRPFLRDKWRAPLKFFPIPSPAVRWAFAVGVVFLFLGASWLVIETTRLRGELEQFKTEQLALVQREQELQAQVNRTRDRSEQLAEQLEREKEQRAQLEQQLKNPSLAQPTVVSFVLTASLLRSAEKTKQLVIPRGASFVQLQLDLESKVDYKSYRAVLETDDGKELWSQDLPAARTTQTGRAVVLRLPALVLEAGDYLLKLNGANAAGVFEEIDEYFFRILKR